MAKKIKYKGTNVTEYAASGGSIPGITGSESVQRNFFLHQLYEWQDSNSYRDVHMYIERMFSDFPGADSRIRANVTTRSGSSGSLSFPTSSSYIKSINYVPPKAILRKTYTQGDGTLPTDRDYMRYIIVGGGGGGGKGTSPKLGTGVGGAGGGGGGISFGEAKIGGFSYEVGEGGNGATAHGNRGSTGGVSEIYVSSSYYVRASGGQGGGNETLTGSRGSAQTKLNTANLVSGYEITGFDGGRNRAAGQSRYASTFTVRTTLGLGDLIDGGNGLGWKNLLESSSYFGSTAPGGARDDVNGGGGGGGASLGQGGRIVRSGNVQTLPGIGGGGAGGPGKGSNGQKGGDGVIYIFW